MSAQCRHKSTIDRLRFYLRKSNEYGQASYDYLRRRTDRKPPENRFSRLMSYKDALNRSMCV